LTALAPPGPVHTPSPAYLAISNLNLFHRFFNDRPLSFFPPSLSRQVSHPRKAVHIVLSSPSFPPKTWAPGLGDVFPEADVCCLTPPSLSNAFPPFSIFFFIARAFWIPRAFTWIPARHFPSVTGRPGMFWVVLSGLFDVVFFFFPSASLVQTKIPPSPHERSSYPYDSNFESYVALSLPWAPLVNPSLFTTRGKPQLIFVLRPATPPSQRLTTTSASADPRLK